ncbi:MAG: hypothetical protein ABR987_20285 [Terracidiphilus sp.]|jgi:hypothetical protein
MTDPVQTAMLVVQTFGLLGLGWYALETRKMRKASQDQVTISRDLISAAMDQVEGLSKPCLTISSELRDPADVILEMGRAVGSLVARDRGGFFLVENIGNGVALNVSYKFVHRHDPSTDLRRERYIQNILAGQSVSMVESLSAFRATEDQIILKYESIGGREYRTIITMVNLVLTSFVFEPVKPLP